MVKKNLKWVVEAPTVRGAENRQQYWEDEHVLHNYENVYSLTEDKCLQNDIVDTLKILSFHKNILIPGCGYKGILEQVILDRLPDCTSVVCTDFPGVIEELSRNNKLDGLVYKGLDSNALGMNNEFDAVVIVNSILSDSDIENRSILKSCFNALKPGGSLVGLFPNCLVTLDMYSTSGNKDIGDLYSSHVDIASQSFGDPVQGDTQVFYTPLKLRYVLQEAGFDVDRRTGISSYFLDSAFFMEQAKDMYGFDDPDLPLYENFVIAQKPNI